MSEQLPEVTAPTEPMPVPVTGELIEPRDTPKVLETLLYLREWHREMYQPFIAALEAAVLEFGMDPAATYTLRLGGLVASAPSPQAAHSYAYDGERLRRRLRAAGLPKEQVERAVKVEKTYRPDAAFMKTLAQHPTYGPIVEACRTATPKRRGVTVKRDV